jgi:hypothetical protein
MIVIDETDSDFRKLIEQDFGSLSSATNLDSALLDWLHFRARIIPARPRQVVTSPQIAAHGAHQSAVRTINDALRVGGDMAPWLSNRVNARKKDPLADLMFNDWQITHFHLSQVFQSSQKMRRTRDLLFAYVNADYTVLLDIAPHGSWALRELLSILLRTYPKAMMPLKGVTGMERQFTDAEYLTLRNSGGNVLLEIDGQVFTSPGMGIMSSKHAQRIVRFRDHLRLTTRTVEYDVARNNLPHHLSQAIFANIALPVRLGMLFRAGEFVVYDKSRQLALRHLGCLE